MGILLTSGHSFQINPESAVKQLTVPQSHLDVEAEEPEEEEFEDVEVEVPYTYQEEVIEEREEVREEVVKKSIPQIKALYAYQGQGMAIEKGEVRYFDCIMQSSYSSNGR